MWSLRKTAFRNCFILDSVQYNRSFFRAKNKQEEAANNNEQNSEAHLQTIKRDFFGQSIPYKRMSKPPIPDVIQLDKSPSAKKRHFGDSISR